MTRSVPFISRILIFPIKSLDPVEVTNARVLTSGALADDRCWALFDAQGRVVNGKNHAEIHRIRAGFDLDKRTVSLRDDSGRGLPTVLFNLDGTARPIEAWLSRFFGFPVHLRADTTTGHPDDTDSPGPTIISVATLEAIGIWFGLPVEQVRARFRTNIEIGGVPAFWEDALFGALGDEVEFHLGGTEWLGINPCQRCVVPSRDPLTGQRDNAFARRFAEYRRRTQPAWSNPARFNHFFRVAINTRSARPGVNTRIALNDIVTTYNNAAACTALEENKRPAGF